jgi:large subunit ribosomal protein L40
MLFLRNRRAAEERDLERQYDSMRAACEHLRLLDENGIQVSEAEAGGSGPDAGRLGVKGKEVGRLYRGAMNKRGVWGSVPVEYARGQVDFPAREGWNHGWTRQ